MGGRGVLLQDSSDQIPNDIIFCILMYLPVKSLLRFKTVSKSWTALITDPCFVREHHSRRPLSKLLLVERCEQDGTRILFPMPLSFDTTTKTLCAHPNVYQPVKPYLSDQDSVISIMGTCYGVFCFAVWNNRRRTVKIKLFNIATGETKVCPSLNFGKYKVFAIAFGFRFAHNDISSVPEFKVVALIYYLDLEGDELKCSAHVYTSTTNSWKSAGSCQSFIYGKGIEVSGVFHWKATILKGTNYDEKFILTFDLLKEVFGRIEMPQGTDDALLTKQDDQYLSLIACTSLSSDYFVDMWVMHVGESWVRQARIGPLKIINATFLGFWHCVGGLLWKVRGEKDDEIVMNIGGNLYKFCVQFSNVAPFDYVESLASFNF